MAAVVASTRAGSSALTMTLRPLEVKPAASEIWTSRAVGLDRLQGRAELGGLLGQVDGRVQPDGERRAVGGPAALGGEDRLEAGVALTGDARLDELHVRVGREDLSRPGWPGRGRPRDVAPVGGATLTWRIFSEPALMNWVGRSGTRASEAKNRTPAPSTTPSAVHFDAQDGRDGRACRRGPRYERLGSPFSSTSILHLVDEEVREDRHDRQRADERRQQRERDRQGERQEELAHEAADEAERQEDGDRGEGARGDRPGDLARAR